MITEDDHKEIRIDPEFKNRLDPMHMGGYATLERLIVGGGKARDPLIVWSETGILVDGHSRHDICTRLGLPFSVERISFASRDAALAFIDLNQYARRNANENWIALQRGRQYNVEKKTKAEAGWMGGTSKDNESQKPCPCLPTTSNRIATKAGVHGNTVKNDARYATAVDIFATAGAPLHPVMEAKRSVVIKAAKLHDEARAKVIAKLAEAPKLKLKAAITSGRKEAEKEAADAASVHYESGTSIEAPPIIEIGGHLLMLGDNTDPEIRARLPDRVALAFCDPPYNSTKEEWDGKHAWNQDYLEDISDIVAVTPGISALQDFMGQTKMQYRWSTACIISNGMTRGALGFGNWMFTALFSKNESIHKNRQDIAEISIRSTDKYDGHDLGSKRQKPPGYLAWLFGLLTEDGDTILDPFAGSGTSIIVAHKMGRHCIGIEKDPKTYQAMVARIRRMVNGERPL